jgi:hypothetical protein
MQVYIFGLTLVASLASAYPEPTGHEWQAPGADDSMWECTPIASIETCTNPCPE